jgi:hypothetical protein
MAQCTCGGWCTLTFVTGSKGSLEVMAVTLYGWQLLAYLAWCITSMDSILHPLTHSSLADSLFSTCHHSVGEPLPHMPMLLKVGGYVMASAVHLMEKQQTFNWLKVCGPATHHTHC